MQILIVDDIPEYLYALSRALGKEHKILCAQSLEEAKTRMTAGVGLAIVDVRLSETDAENREGILLLKWIKEKHPRIPVLLMSAYRDYEAVVDAVNLGADGYLKKPVNLQELKQLIAELTR